MKMYQCPACREDKPVADFYVSGKSGRQWCCKECEPWSTVRVKRCPRCGEVKSLTEFYENRSSGSLQCNCKKCSMELYAKYRVDRMKSDPEWAEARLAYRREWGRRNRLKIKLKRFNVTAERYEELLEAQGGVCAICGGEPEVIDHDHECCATEGSCGECVRGALCRSCNVGISRFKDEPELLLSAAEYLDKWRCRVR